ncbi:hypothetical protein [Vibrio parahaemolyticus]|uniref:hypothetical protein n=1 Tax=Vibrio parahaemolyticus TaxID=670 RepID=UPI00111D064E|nr:hypothetical protein [Vibrio parahaemolyticus]TOP61911.1 hypothetical protein CGH13_20630 [Vibrio parahaemolyticus]
MTVTQPYYLASSGSIIVAIQEPNFTKLESIFAFAYHTDKPKLATQLEISFNRRGLSTNSAITINIDGLWGNGESSDQAQKGIGTTLVSSTLGWLRNSELNCKNMAGKLHEDNYIRGEELPDSHYRRVRFWKKIGMIILDEENSSSKMSGNLSDCNPVIFPQDFIRVQAHPHTPHYEELALLLPWSELDQRGLDKLTTAIRDSDSFERYDQLISKRESIEAEWSSQSTLISLVRAIISTLIFLLPANFLPAGKWEKASAEITKEHEHIIRTLDNINSIISEVDVAGFGLLNRAIKQGKFPEVSGLSYVNGHCCKLKFEEWKEIKKLIQSWA